MMTDFDSAKHSEDKDVDVHSGGTVEGPGGVYHSAYVDSAGTPHQAHIKRKRPKVDWDRLGKLIQIAKDITLWPMLVPLAGAAMAEITDIMEEVQKQQTKINKDADAMLAAENAKREAEVQAKAKAIADKALADKEAEARKVLSASATAQARAEVEGRVVSGGTANTSGTTQPNLFTQRTSPQPPSPGSASFSATVESSGDIPRRRFSGTEVE